MKAEKRLGIHRGEIIMGQRVNVMEKGQGAMQAMLGLSTYF